MIGPEKLHHSFNQSDSNLKQITTCSPAFSRVSGCLVFLLGLFVWLWKVEAVVKTMTIWYWTIQTSFALRDTSFQLSDIHRFNSAIYIIVMYLVSFFRSLGTFQFSYAYFAREWRFLMLSFKAEIGARLARIDPLAHVGCWTAVCRVPHKWLILLSDGNHFFLTSR